MVFKPRLLISVDSVVQVRRRCSPCQQYGADSLMDSCQLTSFNYYSLGQKTKTLGRTGGYAKAIPDITAALKRGKIKGLPLFLMGHSYVRF
jgi:hypothetical protein